jgi:hypothetical protein
LYGSSAGIGQQTLSTSSSSSSSSSLGALPFVADAPTKKMLRFKFALPNSPIQNMVLIPSTLPLSSSFSIQY